GGGGGGMAMIELRQVQPPAPEVVVEPVPEPVPEPEEVVVEPEQVVIATPPAEPDLLGAPAEAGASTPGEGGQGGAGSGPATGGGEGAGGGGEGEEGASRIIPPTPRGIFIPPPGRPASARGQEITVWVFVNESGRADRNQIRLEPPTSDARYNPRLMQSVAEWVFGPATQAGRPVAVWYPFQIIL